MMQHTASSVEADAEGNLSAAFNNSGQLLDFNITA